MGAEMVGAVGPDWFAGRDTADAAGEFGGVDGFAPSASSNWSSKSLSSLPFDGTVW
jgi:hypothetical protein